MPQIVLALDEGTTGCTAAYFEADGLVLLGNAKVEFEQIFPKPGWVEHSPDAIWASMLKAIKLGWEKAVAANSNLSTKDIVAIGVTNQRETVVPWDRKSGEAAGNAIVWQDRRTSERCDALKSDQTSRAQILKKTGLVCDPYFSGSKMEWLLKNSEPVNKLAANGTLVLGTIDSFVIYKLTGGAVVATEDSNASRTMLYNLDNGGYDASLCKLFGVSTSFLPEIKPSFGHFGVTRGVPGLHDGIPITGCLGDQQAALFGHGIEAAGEGKITYGTGAFLLVSTGERSVVADNGLLATVAFREGSKRSFALEGSAFIAGAALQFLRDNFKWFDNAALSEKIALESPRDPNVLFVPALAGLGAPYWNPNAKGVLFGLTRGTNRSQIVRAVLESIALQNVEILRLMTQSAKLELKRLGVDGGAARSDMLMQFQSDMTRTKLVRPANIETTAKGAARAALRGLDSGRTIISKESHVEFSPKMPHPEASQIAESWRKAANCVDSFYR